MNWNPEEIAEFFANNEHTEIVNMYCANSDFAHEVFHDMILRDFSEEIINKFGETFL